jgi:biotin synthase
MTDRPHWDALADRALAGEAITPDEARAVLAAPDEELLRLVGAVARVRRAHFGAAVKLNFLLNVKSGLCPEDCHYCSQSSLSTAEIARYPMLAVADVVAAAERAVRVKAARFCMVASGRGPTDREVAQVCEAVAAVRAAHPELEVCACLGLLKGDQAERLRAAGVFAYNHNLNTSERFYPEICATHTYGDRVQTLQLARAAGLSSCCGALFGMGENLEDVIALAYALRTLRVDSIPVNFLIPIPGTPLSGRAALGPRAALKILCLFRLLNPTAELRIAGGREVQLRWLQPLGLEIANSIFVGDYLTTTGQPPQADFAMIRDLGLSILGHEEAAADDGPMASGEGGFGGAGRLTRRPNT